MLQSLRTPNLQALFLVVAILVFGLLAGAAVSLVNPAIAFALVAGTGAVSQSKGVASVVRNSAGSYTVNWNSPATSCAVLVDASYAASGNPVAVENLGGANTSIKIHNATGTLIDDGFTIVELC